MARRFQTIESVREQEAALAKSVAEAGDDAAKKREARKRLKRAQRLRRRMVAAEAKRKGKATPEGDAESAD